MGNTAKIEKISFSRLNKTEFQTFIRDVFKRLPLAEDGSAPAIGLSKEFVDEFRAVVHRYSEAVRLSWSAPQTALLKAVDQERDKILTGFIARVMLTLQSPIEAERKAAQALALLLKGYRGAAYIPVMEESGAINTLSLHLRDEKYAPHVATLGMVAYQEELEKIERKYGRLVREREEYWKQIRAIGSATSIRKRLEELYEKVAVMAVAYNALYEKPEADDFISTVNYLIKRTRTDYKRRKKRQWKKKQKEGNADS